MGDKGRYTFDATADRMSAQMAQGHLARKGHVLRGVWVYLMPGYRRLQRTCCK